MFLPGEQNLCAAMTSLTDGYLHTCHYSAAVFDADSVRMKQKPPTVLYLMPSRYLEILQATRGRNCSGIPLVAFNGHFYFQAGLSDDPGIAQLISSISSHTENSPETIYDWIEFLIAFCSAGFGCAGFFKLYKANSARIVGTIVFFCLACVQAIAADVYIFQSAPLIAGIPWLLYYAQNLKLTVLTACAMFIAFCCSWCSLIRSGTLLIGLVFISTLLVGRWWKWRIVPALMLIFAACIPATVFEKNMIAERNTFLAGQGEVATAEDSHPIWHSIYIGLGFIPNSVVPAYDDSSAINKVRSIDPSAPFTSKKYENILKHEVLNIAIHKPMVLFLNIVIKTAIVVASGFVLLLPAARILYRKEKQLWFDGSFLLAIMLSSLSGILVVPKPRYLLTFLCLTSLYSLFLWCRFRFLPSTEREVIVCNTVMNRTGTAV
jgi:hypothetical protein